MGVLCAVRRFHRLKYEMRGGIGQVVSIVSRHDRLEECVILAKLIFLTQVRAVQSQHGRHLLTDFEWRVIDPLPGNSRLGQVQGAFTLMRHGQ